MAKILQLLVGVILIIALMISPVGISKSLERWDNLQTQKTATAELASSLEDVRSSIVSSKDTFVSNRTFEVSYDDAENLILMFQSLPIFKVQSVKVLDASMDYSEVGDYYEGYEGNIDGVTITMEVEDMARALEVLDTMQLCIMSIKAEAPMLTVSFNTRGV